VNDSKFLKLIAMKNCTKGMIVDGRTIGIFALGCMLFFYCQVFSQNVDFAKENFKDQKDAFKTAKNEIEQGDALYVQGTIYYKQALVFFLKANEFNSNNAALNFKIGQCYLYSNFKLKSIPFLEKAFALNNAVDLDIHYSLGKAYHLNMQWDKAITEFTAFKSAIKQKEHPIIFEDAQKHIEECVIGKKMVQNPIRVFIDNVGPEINSPFSDYGPVISADESMMLFTSRRPGSTGGKIDPGLNEYFEDIYLSTKKDGKWTKAVNLGSPINTDNHDANSGLSADGQKFLIYMGKNNGDLYESELKGEVWSKPEAMNKNINSDNFHESSACYSPNGNLVYFVTDNPNIGGYGNRDIYVSAKDSKGKWGKPTNLGPTINTKYDEEGIFIHPDGKTLYFSSRGHQTMGGYDIFKTVFDEASQKWSIPENLGYPVNTADDDVFFVVSANGRHAYYTSFSANGFGENDIYRITFLGNEKPVILNNEDNLLASVAAPVKETVVAPAMEVKDAQLTILKGTIIDALTLKPLEAIIDIVDNATNEVIASFTSNSASGKYLVSLPAGRNYGIAVKKENYLFHSENFDIPATAAFQEVKKDVELKNIAVGSKIILKNIFFDFGKASLRQESTSELLRLIKLLNEVPSMHIEISGHTDAKGSSEYNQSLSDNRAKAVVDYLVKAGISTNRLSAAGYGKDQPIATNETEEGRQMNRRTEFKILKM
jgi:outer membrane protein OmpA-like peptidoglycan-associated protein/tetratricopeptide (TPR) repeat protein